MTDDLPFHYDPPPPEPDDREPRKCRRHMWGVVDIESDPPGMRGFGCLRCGRIRDEAASSRGRRNRNRGNAIERQVGKSLGLTRVGQYGTPTDLGNITEPFAVQVKSGDAFPERMWRWLKAVPAVAGQTPLLVIADTPGPGTRRRAVVVLDLDEWIALHGETP